VFREVNERARELSDSWSDASSTFQIVCECCHSDCVEPVRVTTQAYLAVRSHPARFIVAPGHGDASIEDVIDHHEDFDVVEKTGEAWGVVASLG
jgi:hypothetical protein